MWILILLSLTIALYLLPLLPALLEWRLEQDVYPLNIIQSHEGHIRYFAERFRTFIQHEIKALGLPKETANPAYGYSVVDGNDIFRPSPEELQNRVTQRIILAFGTLDLRNDFIFTREIYGQQSVQGGENNRFRAILAEGDLTLGPNSVVLRWAHARIIRVAPDCRILGRLSAEEEILFKPGCTFTRVHAPCVKFMSDIHPLHSRGDKRSKWTAGPRFIASSNAHKPDDTGRTLVDGNLEFPDNSTWFGNIVVRGDILIHHGAKILGSVKAHGELRVEHDVTIEGSLIGNKSIIIGRDGTIGGPVVAGNQVDINAGTVIGTVEKPATVTAPIIRIASKTVVYGTVWASEYGVTLLSL